MSEPISLDYLAEYFDLEPSLFRESGNLHKVFSSIFTAYHKQQEQLLWLSNNVLNIDLAEKSQLDFIGSIVGQSRILIDFNAESYFGFDGAYKSDTFGASGAPYVGGYWNSRSYFNTSSARNLTDEEYRRIIKARIIYNHSSGTADDILRVVNLITNKNNNSVQTMRHGFVKIKTADETGLLSYFLSRLETLDNILPIAAGVSVNIENASTTDYIGKDMTIFVNLLEKIVNEDLPDAFGDNK